MISAVRPQTTGELDGDRGGERAEAATPVANQWVVDTATGRVIRRRVPARAVALLAEGEAETKQ